MRIVCSEESACAKRGYNVESDDSYLPEVLDNGILFVVAAVVGVLGPVVDINLGDTTDQQLELTLIKDVDEI